MSLFQARTWWTAKPGNEEEYDYGGFCVANIDNEASGNDKIITGSFEGFLRIYYPHQMNFRVEDLMLEMNLEQPILQVAAGRFVANSNGLALAVLHPRRLVVYTVVAHPSHYELTKNYEHRLDRTAFNLCYGPFGGVQAKDFMCVQSLDGQLSFFEQDSFAFSRYLPNFLLPGPITYVQKTDSFVTFNSQMEVESYKYHMLGASSAAADDEKDVYGLTTSKKLQIDWSVSVGEPLLHLQVARFSRSLAASQIDILLLGERTLFTLKESGAIRLQKRFDYNPSACTTYVSSPEDVGGSNQNLLVGTHQNFLMLYRDTQLVWAAKYEIVPVALKVATFGGVRGLVAGMSDSGQILITYMGTDPPVPHSLAEAKELDYEAMDAEHRRLLKLIKEATNDALSEPVDRLVLRATVPNFLDPPREDPEEDDTECARDETGKIISVTIRLYVSYTGRDNLENVSLSIGLPAGLITDDNSIVLPLIRGSGAGVQTPLILNIRVRPSKSILPNSMKGCIIGAYTTGNQEPRTSLCPLDIPLFLIARPVPPIKNPLFFVTLDTNRSPPPLNELFDDVLRPVQRANPDIQRHAANALTLQYYANNQDCTILVSKKAGRFRLQGSSLDVMWILTSCLVQRLQLYFMTHAAVPPSVSVPPTPGFSDMEEKKEGDADLSTNEPFKITLVEDLPFPAYFAFIDQHFQIRQQINELKGQLENLAHQFRAIQKRLLARYKDKNPAPLKNMDVLMNETYEALLAAGSQLEQAQTDLVSASNRLSCATNFFLLLIQLKYELDSTDAETLSSYLSPVINDELEQGWEECTDAALGCLLRTLLAKNARDQANVAQPLSVAKDTAKLKKHIQTMCERFSKGMRFLR